MLQAARRGVYSARHLPPPPLPPQQAELYLLLQLVAFQAVKASGQRLLLKPSHCWLKLIKQICHFYLFQRIQLTILKRQILSFHKLLYNHDQIVFDKKKRQQRNIQDLQNLFILVVKFQTHSLELVVVSNELDMYFWPEMFHILTGFLQQS